MAKKMNILISIFKIKTTIACWRGRIKKYLKLIFKKHKNQRLFNKLTDDQINILNTIDCSKYTVIHKNRACGVSSILLLDIINNILDKKQQNALFIANNNMAAHLNKQTFLSYIKKLSESYPSLKIVNGYSKYVLIEYKKQRSEIYFTSLNDDSILFGSDFNNYNVYMDEMTLYSNSALENVSRLSYMGSNKTVYVVDYYDYNHSKIIDKINFLTPYRDDVYVSETIKDFLNNNKEN